MYLLKIGWVRYRNSRDVIGTIKNVTVSYKCGKWFVSVQTEYNHIDPVHTGNSVGIDMGIARFATLTNGQFFEAKNSLKIQQDKLVRLQRRLSHKKKFSKNWRKQKQKLSRHHSHIANVRRDYLHKITTRLSKNHAIVCMEDLKITNMSKSSKGNAEQHGKNVKQKSGLNRSILDQSWFEFKRQLDYKLFWNGGQLITVNPKNTSRTCPCCGFISAENRKTQADFKCVECSFEENADLVGATNILRAGLAQLACEVNNDKLSATGTRRGELVLTD